MDLEKALQTFLKPFFPLEKPLLLGFSGGEDSLVLAHLLKKQGIAFAIAHFDHGWRTESRVEAQKWQAWADKQKIPFHTKSSRPKDKTELLAREERYQFFQQLFQTRHFQALVLAHHRQDQVETVLKRVFEGAQLPNLKGMRPQSQKDKLPIWRPLLQVSKETIKEYIKTHQLEPLDDSTNRDPRYLRARMRQTLIPELSKEFGKEISPSLIQLGEYASELDSYLAIQIQKYEKTKVEGPFGVMWDFTPYFPLQPVEMSYVLRSLFMTKEETPSRSIIQRLTKALQTKTANHRIPFGKNVLIVDRAHLFWIQKPLPKFSKKIFLKEGNFSIGDWEWNIRFGDVNSLNTSTWKQWWTGKIALQLPEGKYELHPPKNFFKKQWNAYKVPAFLRESLPIACHGEEKIGEFLTGKALSKKINQQILVMIEVNSREK